MSRKGYVRLPSEIAKAIGRTFVSPEDASDIYEVWEALRRRLTKARKPKAKSKAKPKAKPKRKPPAEPVFEFRPSPTQRKKERKPKKPAPPKKPPTWAQRCAAELAGDDLPRSIEDFVYCHALFGTYWHALTVEFSRPVELYEDIRYIVESMYFTGFEAFGEMTRVSLKAKILDVIHDPEVDARVPTARKKHSNIDEGWRTVTNHYRIGEIRKQIGKILMDTFEKWNEKEPRYKRIFRQVTALRVEFDMGSNCTPTDEDRRKAA